MTTFLRVWVALFFPALLIQLWLEKNNKVDSIGLWYSIYCALGYSLPIALLVGLFFAFRSARSQRGADDEPR